jgi:hypothetical protein
VTGPITERAAQNRNVIALLIVRCAIYSQDTMSRRRSGLCRKSIRFSLHLVRRVQRSKCLGVLEFPLITIKAIPDQYLGSTWLAFGIA